MGWRDNLLPASFRGVPFSMAERSLETGRRTTLHEYPHRDEPFSEDLGRRAKRFSVSAFVVGDDYMDVRDRLLEACEKAGPGELVDPWRGSTSVTCPRCSLVETFGEGAFARFTLTFEEAGENVAPALVVDTRSVVSASATGAITAAQVALQALYSVTLAPSYLGGKAQTVLGAVADGLDVVEKAARSATGTPAGEAVRDLQEFRAAIPTLAQDPETLSQEITDHVTTVAALEDDPERRVDQMLELVDTGALLAVELTTTPGRIQAGANQTAILSTLRRAALAEAGKAASEIPFSSNAQAQDVRDAILEKLDDELLVAGELDADESYLELRALYSSIATDLQARAATLARVISFTPNATAPALSIAQHLYGDATREAELVDRNAIRHSGFTPGGAALEVLTDA